jgi:hypothetical protein
MAHSVALQVNEPVELVFAKDKKNRVDRPVELYGLVPYCKEGIIIRESFWTSIKLRSIDKFSTLKTSKLINLNEIFGIHSMKETFDIPSSLSGIKLLRGFFQNINMLTPLNSLLVRELQSYLQSIPEPDNPDGHPRQTIVHFRRGDTTQIATEWGILGYDYYREILGENASLTVVTDDSSYASEIQQYFPKAEILTPDICDSWQALKIMTNAEHLVMANSTLSWWAGWLMGKGANKCSFPYPWRPGDKRVTENLLFENAIPTKSEFKVI